MAFHLANLGASYYHVQDFDEARKLLLRAQEIYRRLQSTERDSFINWYLKRLLTHRDTICAEQGGQPERRIGRLLKSKVLGRHRVTLVVRRTRGFTQGQTKMAAEWFYEYDGKKVGPVPDATLRHLANHGVISPVTNVWKSGMDAPVSASRIKNLFTDIVDAPIVSESSPNETVTQYLSESLEACRNEDDDRMNQLATSVHVIHPFTVSSILLDYEILDVRKLPTPIQNSSTPPDQRTKPVRQVLEATVHVVLCDRPNYRASLDEIRRLQPGRREETVVYECREFKDGDWIILDADLTR